ncbi:hypothetical protein D3C86_1972840 [compost metagenome]
MGMGCCGINSFFRSALPFSALYFAKVPVAVKMYIFLSLPIAIAFAVPISDTKVFAICTEADGSKLIKLDFEV